MAVKYHQPKGGYLSPHKFNIELIYDGIKLSENENVHPSIIGMAVDYYTRFLDGVDVELAFKISLEGARKIHQYGKAIELIKIIDREMTDEAITCACKLVGYDVCSRSSIDKYVAIETINPNLDTINNIRIMIKRTLKFIDKYGPIVESGFTFEGGYTDYVSCGDGDFISEDTLWDLKTTKHGLDSQGVLQLLIYYLLGKHSYNHELFDSLTKLGIFNARLNCIYTISINSIDDSVLTSVENKILRYDNIIDDLDVDDLDEDDLDVNDLDEEDLEIERQLSFTPKTKKVVSKQTYSSEKGFIGREKFYSLPELIKYTGWSRYTIMKYYNYYGLPLFKEKNRYYIRIQAFNEWYEELKRKRENQNILLIGFTFLFFIIFILILCFVAN